MEYAFIYILLILLILGVPVAFSLLGSILVFSIVSGQEFLMASLSERLFAGISQFPLLAIPMFILSADIMNKSGITKSLINLSYALLGRLPGSLAQVSTLANVMFAALCGANSASTAAIGGIMIPEMIKKNYPRGYATALTVAAGIIGTIIPPSVIIIIYSFIMSTSIPALFAGGIIPGVCFGLGLMIYNHFFALKHGLFDPDATFSWRALLKAFKEAGFALMVPVIILGGIFMGIATPTEVGAAAALYALVVGVFFGDLKIKEIPGVFISAAKTSSTVLIIVGSALVFSYMMSISQLPVKLSNIILGVFSDKISLLLVFNILLLILGMFVDATAAILLVGPILIPALMRLGVHPVHIGVITIVNLSIGALTPPFGTALFVGASIGQISIENLFKNLFPMFLIELGLLLLFTYVPEFTLFLPRLLGLI